MLDLKYLELSKAKISYISLGDKHNPSLVFLPGWAGSIEFWHHQIAFFSVNYHVLAIDIPGFGSSSISADNNATPEDTSMETLADLILEVIMHEKVKSCSIIGHSMGGTIALCVGAKNPQIVNKVIGVDAYTHLEIYPEVTEENTRTFVEGLQSNFSDSTKALASTYFRKNSDIKVRDHVCSVMSSVNPHIALEILSQFLRSSLAEQLDNYPGQVHTIVSQSEYDKDSFVKVFGESVNVVPIKNTCHFVMLDVPQRFNSALKSLITQS